MRSGAGKRRKLRAFTLPIRACRKWATGSMPPPPRNCRTAITPRTVAIANGTLAAAVGLGLQLWIPGVVLWIVGHSLAVWGARVDPQFMQVFARHIKHRPLLDV